MGGPGLCAAAMSVFARLLLHNGAFFLEIFAQSGALGLGHSQWPESFIKFLDQWLDRWAHRAGMQA